MKNISSIPASILTAIALSAMAVGCVEEMPEVQEEMNLSRVLTPSSTSASVSTADGCTVTFTWTNSNTATDYLVQVFQFPTETAPETVTDETLEGMTPEEVTAEPSASGSSSSISVKLDAEYSYYARVCARNTAEGSQQADSRWAAFPYPIDTYTVMDPVKFVTVTERTSGTITVSWELEEGDTQGVNQIRVTPHPTDPEAAYLVVPVEAGATSATVGADSPLPASTKFTLSAHYNSANRGEVTAWTMPSLENPTEVSNSEQLCNALADGAPEILVKNSAEPYSLTIEAEDGTESAAVIGLGQKATMSIYGEGTADGSMPVIVGGFTIPNGMTSFHLEGLAFDGDSYTQSHLITLAKDFATATVSSISMLNCTVTGYKSGVFYDNETTGGASVTINELSFDNIVVTDIQGSGGNGFDIRKIAALGNISVTESTFSDGFRTFFRIDASTVQSLKFNHNTVNNICYVDDGNNKGLFYIGAGKDQVSIPVFELKNNLFLNLNGHDERTVFFSDATGVPTVVSSNYYYNLGPGFWEKDDSNENGKGKWSQSEGLAGNGVILSSDPCVNSERGILNVTNASVLAAEAGDPRWFADYVEQPDPELVPVEYETTWNLTDQDTYYDVIDESCVRGNTRFIIASNPINVTEDGFGFTAEASLEYGGTPNDCAMAFLVDGPGSVVLSTIADGSTNDHITVAYGPADGSSATVAGAAYAGAERVKIAFADFLPDEQHLVYIYACGPIVLSELSWVEDTDTGEAPVLATPSNLSLGGNATVDDTYEGTVTLTWDEVPYAASYKVTVTDAAGAATENTVTSPSYDLNPSVLGPGTYTITVQSMPAETDLNRQPSELSEPVVFTVNETLKPVYVETTWGSDYFTRLETFLGEAEAAAGVAEDFVFENLGFVSGGSTVKIGTTGGAKRAQTGGGKPGTKASWQIMVGGPGTLVVNAVSSGDPRKVVVALGETVLGEYDAPDKESDPVNITVDIPDATSGSIVNIYSSSGSINFMSFTWTPEQGEGIYDESAINESFTAPFSDVTVYAPGDVTSTVTTSDKVTWGADSGHKITFDSERSAGGRIKMGGGADSDGTTVPTYRYASFKVTKPGTIVHKVISSGSDIRDFVVILVKEGSQIIELYSGQTPADGQKDDVSAIHTPITAEHLAGITQAATVYIFSLSGGVNLYELGYTLE